MNTQARRLQLVRNIADFDYIVTSSEKESLLLEVTLIQKYQPYYNIRLKQGTGYPYIKITNERDPQIMLVSDVKKDGAHYFGPYPNVYAPLKKLCTSCRKYIHYVVVMVTKVARVCMPIWANA